MTVVVNAIHFARPVMAIGIVISMSVRKLRPGMSRIAITCVIGVSSQSDLICAQGNPVKRTVRNWSIRIRNTGNKSTCIAGFAAQTKAAR